MLISDMRKIVVIGGGFSGIAAARTLRKRLAGMKRVEITLISDRAHFLASPSLPNVATGQTNLSQITTHLSKLVSSPVRIEIGQVINISPDDKIIHTEKTDLPYDFAIIATGSTLDWRGLDPANKNVIGCKTSGDFMNVHERVAQSLDAAVKLVDELEQNVQAIQRLCTLVIVGAGPTGVSLASKLKISLDEPTMFGRKLSNRLLIDEKYAQRYSKLRSFMKVMLVDADDRVLTQFPDLSNPVRDELHKLGVELSLKTKVTVFEESQLFLESDESILSSNIFWCGGVKRHHFFDQPETGRVGDASLRHLKHREIYVVGDCVDNQASTMNAHCAVAQGHLAASNIVADLAGRKASRWTDRRWPVVIDMGAHTIALNSRGDVLKGRSARVYAKTSRAKLLNEWTGGMSTWKFLVGEVIKSTSNRLFLDD